MENKIRIALYMRLSKEDEWTSGESNSISNQRFLLRDYVTGRFGQYEITEFVDDGYSGTSLERPAVKRLLEAARKRKIDCIIVKDFSRFSRDYVEAGSYIEQIFPFLGIRFISVNDVYDSRECEGNTAGMNQAFKNLINDLYSKDLSVKVKSSLDLKKNRGIYCSGNCPFGYRKKEGDRHQVEIVEEEAVVIRRIYQMTLEGCTSVEIARQFGRESIKTPMEFLMARGAVHRTFAGREFFWDHSVICSILKNEFYVGDIVYGKYERISVGGKSRLKPRDEWRIYRNHHEPVIEREVFEAVQKTRGKVRKKSGREPYSLQGKMICGGCKRALSIRYSHTPYLYCNSRYVSGRENCLRQIDSGLVEKIVLLALQGEIRERLGIENLKKQYQDILREKYGAVCRQCCVLQGKLRNMERENLISYERYAKGELEKDEYIRLKNSINIKKEKLSLVLQEKEELLKEMEEQLKESISETAKIMNENDFQKLSRDAAEIFVSRITLWNDKYIEILWNFNDAN